MAIDGVIADIKPGRSAFEASSEVLDLRDHGAETLSPEHRAMREFRVRVGALATIEDPVVLANLAEAMLRHAGSR